MLKKTHARRMTHKGRGFAIVASHYNSEYVDAMAAAAVAELDRAGAKSKTVRVPGAYEVPLAAAQLARSRKYAAVICLGVILRGETVHAQQIADAVSRALMDIQLETEVPVIHEVLLLENEQQARVRCLDKEHNRGLEAAQTALQMARVLSELR
jgi:6,7-dimethyl-8-ribityllumazine synthase